MDESTRYTVTVLCEDYIRQDRQRRDPDISPTSEIEQFFRVYAPLLGHAVEHILDRAGFVSLEDFFALTDEYIHQDAYRSVLDHLIQSVMI